MYIAHFRESDGAKQGLADHLRETAEISESNGAVLGIPTMCRIAGLLHDTGKFSTAFQDYILAAHNGETVKRGSVDHSTYGGQMIQACAVKTKYEAMAREMIANAIFAHHNPGGLLDFISGEGAADSPYQIRYQKELDEYDKVKELFFDTILPEESLQKLLQDSGNELASLIGDKQIIERTDQFFLTKMVYSALLDGDRRNTQLFEEKGKYTKIETERLFSELADRLEETFSEFQNGEQTTINYLRQKMADACLVAANRPTGIYRLSIPTGGGKTLSSMRFALNHALSAKKRRIIYIIPFSSIIEQNAEVFREKLGITDAEILLEHHANLVAEVDDESEESERKQALMQDNWDSPIIVTTMVRFLENVFAGSTRNPRRIHQLLNSILIFDEIQSLPPKCLSMFTSLINFLKNYGQTTTLLCTATQPTLEKRKVALESAIDSEIVPDLEAVSHAFERVQVIDKTIDEGWNADQLAEFALAIASKEQNLLMILNTKKAVRSVYQKLLNSGMTVFHLSTAMTPNHRSFVLDKIREALKLSEPIICVTTPLIEAGVDISFSCVIRSLSGLDSIAQAAGRCNRNGESNQLQPVYLVNPVKELENIDKMAEIKTKAAITRELLQDRKYLKDESSLLTPELMMRFFDKFYSRVEKTGESEYLFNQGSQQLFDLMQKNSNRRLFYQSMKKLKVPTYLVNSPQTIARHFKVIEQQGESVLVEFGDEGKKLVADLLAAEGVVFDKAWYQRAQRNSLNLYNHEFIRLQKDGLISLTEAGIYVLHENGYDPQYGLNLAGDSLSNYSF